MQHSLADKGGGWGETNRSWHQNNPAVSHCGRFTDAFTVYKYYSCFKGFRSHGGQ